MKPLNDNLILEPSFSKTRGRFYVPDSYYLDATTACRVVSVGSGVNPVVKKDSIVLCQTGFSGRITHRVGNTNHFWCKENNIYGIVRNNIIYPLGLLVLIKRDLADAYHGQIVVPENRRTQSLTGTVVRYGISRKPSKVNGIEIGSKVRLTEWQDWMLQIELEDGSEGLIVKEQDVLFSYEKDQNRIQH